MKRLLVMRHAKSSWKEAGLSDHDRPLNKRGRKTAPVLGGLLVEQQMVPDLIVASTAERTRKTAELVAEACQYEQQIIHESHLYLAPPSMYFNVIGQMPNELETILVIGHNPGVEDLVALLTDRFRPMPTGALAELILDIDAWRQLNGKTAAELRNFWLPRELI